jgi:hypothetical protein
MREAAPTPGRSRVGRGDVHRGRLLEARAPRRRRGPAGCRGLRHAAAGLERDARGGRPAAERLRGGRRHRRGAHARRRHRLRHPERLRLGAVRRRLRARGSRRHDRGHRPGTRPGQPAGGRRRRARPRRRAAADLRGRALLDRGCWCSPGAPPGDVQELGACDTDCDCSEGLSCLPALGPTGALWTCKRPCSRHTDCPTAAAAWTASARRGSAAATTPAPSPRTAPQLLVRHPRLAQLLRGPAPGAHQAPCLCDAECPPGQRCVRALDGAPTCEIPCADDQDCPFDWMVCGTPWICL